MKVLVTGGAGFIGRATCYALRGGGHEPVILDRHRVPRPVEVLLGDVRDATAVTEACAHADAVIHLAGVLGTQETIQNPRPAAEVNVLGGLNVLEACAQYGLPLVNIAVGNWFEHSTYSISKHVVERFAVMYERYRGLPVCSVRALNAYGPGQAVAQPYGPSRVRKVIPSFVSRALHGDPIEVYGDGSQVMDMIHVRDVAAVLVAALEDVAAHGSPGVTYEAGTGRHTTVLDIAQAVQAEVERQAGKRPDITRLPMRPGETPGVVVAADVSTLERLGFKAGDFTPLEEGLAETVGWYREQFLVGTPA